MCTSDDLVELNVPLGPRKKIISFITQQAELKQLAEARREREEKERLIKEREQQKQQEAVDTTLHRATLQGVKIVRGLAGTGQPYIDYPQLSFKPRHLFAVGSPIGLFLSVRSELTFIHTYNNVNKTASHINNSLQKSYTLFLQGSRGAGSKLLLAHLSKCVQRLPPSKSHII